MANYSFAKGVGLPKAEDGQEFVECNFLQLRPNTKIFKGVKNLKFVRCNIMNCDVPDDAELIQTKKKARNFCTNLHPDYVAHGLAACSTECDHMVSKDEIEIDKEGIDTVYTYEDSKP